MRRINSSAEKWLSDAEASLASLLGSRPPVPPFCGSIPNWAATLQEWLPNYRSWHAVALSIIDALDDRRVPVPKGAKASIMRRAALMVEEPWLLIERECPAGGTLEDLGPLIEMLVPQLSEERLQQRAAAEAARERIAAHRSGVLGDVGERTRMGGPLVRP